MDLSIDMGGCFETSRPTSFPGPIYEVDGILHFCVPNLPTTAARSSTHALTNTRAPVHHRGRGRRPRDARLALPDLRRGLVPGAGGRGQGLSSPRPRQPSGSRPVNWAATYGSRITTADEAVKGDPLGRSRVDPRRLQQPRGAGARHGGARRRASRRRGRSPHDLRLGRRTPGPATRGPSATARSSRAATCARLSTRAAPTTCPCSSPRSRASSNRGLIVSTWPLSTSPLPTSTGSARTASGSSARRRPPSTQGG